VISPARALLEAGPYALAQEEKRARLAPALEALTRHHHAECPAYRDVVDRVFGGLESVDFSRLESLPFLPVSMFKSRDLRSVPDDRVLKVLTSSGTTGQRVSRIALDAETSQVQSATLVKVAQHHLGRQRLPMVIVDHPGVTRERGSHSARAAGILGMSQFGHRPFHALRDDMSLDVDGLARYLEAAQGKRVLFFGFTFMVWEHFVRVIEREQVALPRVDGVLVHSGGWKKLEALAVDRAVFRERVRAATGVASVLDFYGMVEQVGSVYFENELHHLHAPVVSEVIVRDPVTLEPVPDGTPGVIQVVSSLPTSYPGHSLLTEDLGVIVGADLPGTALKGRCFDVLGRLPRAELRGCSDTFVRSAA